MKKVAAAGEGTEAPGTEWLTASLDVSGPAPGGELARAGHTVQLLFVDPVTAQAAGTSPAEAAQPAALSQPLPATQPVR